MTSMRCDTRPGLLDTSVFIASERRRRLDSDSLPEQTAVSVVTIAELHAGILAAPDTATRAHRLSTLAAASAVEPLPITAEAARRWAELRVRLAEQGHRQGQRPLDRDRRHGQRDGRGHPRQ